MNIWIQAYGRTGSTTLFRALQYVLDNHWGFSEPYLNENNSVTGKLYQDTKKLMNVKNDYDFYKLKNIIIKNNQWQTPFDNINRDSPLEEFFEFHKVVNKHFDKVILLGRRDDFDWAISSYQSYQSEKYSTPYNWNESNNYLIDEGRMDIGRRWKQFLIELSKNIYHKKITWYEDLYSEDENVRLKQFLDWDIPFTDNDIKILLDLTHPKHRYRRGNTII